MNVPTLRLFNHHLSSPDFERPEQVVSWFGAVQAQDYAAAKWAIGLRMPDPAEEAVERALAEGAILRTHVLRPTWHFVAPEDIRWMLKLTAPRVQAKNALYHRRLELLSADFKRSEAALAKALQGGKFLTRAEMKGVLERAGIRGLDLRFTYLIMHAELEGLICSGPRAGKQFTYMLLEERGPGAKMLDAAEALAELTRRYFRSHGPATLRDFAWWSGLTMTDAKRAVEMLASELAQETLEAQTYYWASSSSAPEKPAARAHLLPNFDEYVVGYTERSAFFDPLHDRGRIPRESMLSHHTILIDGQIAGTWKRTLARDSVSVELSPFQPLKGAESRAVRLAAENYASFLGLKLLLL